MLTPLFGRERVMGGLCFVCLNREEPGLVRHLAHGTVVLGECDRWPEPRTHDIASLFRHAGVPCKVADNLERAHWEKLVWNIPFNGLGVAGAAGYEALTDAPAPAGLPTGAAGGACLSTADLLSDPRWASLVRELMAEVIAAANALGFKIPASVAEKQIERTLNMGAYRASTLVDFERRQPLELESMFLEPLRRARRAGVATPRLEALCRVLTRLDPGADRAR
jgi:2-dehydropantoate 2-reductase